MLERAARRAAGDRAAHRRRGALGRRRGRRPLPRRARRRAAERAARRPSSRTCPTRCARLVRRYARTHGPFDDRASCASATASTRAPALRELERAGDLVRGELRPGGTEREWCDAEVLRRLRRASLAVLRKEIEPADQRALARFLPELAGRGPPPAGGRRRGPAARGRSCRSRASRSRPRCGSATCCRGASAPTRRRGWTSSARRRGRVGRRRRARAQLAAAWRCTSATTRAASARRRSRATRRPSPRTRRSASACARGACFFTDLLVDVDARARGAPGGAVGSRVGGRGHQRRLRAAARAAAHARAGAARASRAAGGGRRFGRRRTGAQRAGPGPLVARPRRSSRDAPEPGPRRRALAELLLERYGIVTREQVLAEGMPGGFSIALRRSSSMLETLGIARRGYFVEGLGGAQFALPGAVERLRAQPRDDDDATPLVLAATDPAQPYGAALPWPKRDEERAPAPRARGGRARRARRRRAGPLRRARRQGPASRSSSRATSALRAGARRARRARAARAHQAARARAGRRRAGGRHRPGSRSWSSSASARGRGS